MLLTGWLISSMEGTKNATRKNAYAENYLESLDELLSYQQVKRNYKNE